MHNQLFYSLPQRDEVNKFYIQFIYLFPASERGVNKVLIHDV